MLVEGITSILGNMNVLGTSKLNVFSASKVKILSSVCTLSL